MVEKFVRSMNAVCNCDALDELKIRNCKSNFGSGGSVSRQPSKFFSLKPTFITAKSSELIFLLLESLKRILSNPKIRLDLIQNGKFPFLIEKEITEDYFFKPNQSYGGKGSYSGKKISRKKFDEIMNQDYIVQEFIEPSINLTEPKFYIEILNNFE